jgi:translation initiation factor IF-1
MPGVSARSAVKNMSKSKRSAILKNTIRVDAAVTGKLELCTYGKVKKALGNKMFVVADTNRREHLAYIRGRMSRINVDDVVLLNVREYETRAGTDKSVFDIMAVFSAADIHRLYKNDTIPVWMTMNGDAVEGSIADDIFDYEAVAHDTPYGSEEDATHDNIDIDDI